MFRAPLWIVAGILILAGAWGLLSWADSRRRQLQQLLGHDASLTDAQQKSALNRSWSMRLRLAAFGFLALALSGPRWGVELMETRSSSRQVVIAIDTSLSMQTTDAKPNRLERAKSSLSLLLDQLAGDRVAVVAFAGDAQIVCPLTNDITAAKDLLSALDVGAVPVPGTAVGTAIRTSTALIGRYPGQKNVVLLTDGEDHRSDPAAAAKEAAASGVRLFTIGIGSPEGEPIPLENGGYKKDPKGMTVVSRLDEGMLMEAAKISGGDYYRSTPSMDEISHISTKIKEGDPTQGLAGTTTRWKDRYSWPLTVALLLILLELVLPMRSRIPTKISLVMLGLLLHGLPAQSAVGDGTLRAANKKYHAGNYEEALDLYGQASAERPSDPRPIFNAGDALYRLDRSCEAAGAFNSIATHASADPHLRSAAFYNLGNSLYHDGQYAQAASAYRNSLALTPGDQDARRNLIIALQRQKNPPPKKKNDPNKKNQSPDQKENPQKQQENSQQPRSRPQNEMTQQEAERVMRAVAEKEKSARQAAKDQLYGRRNPPKSPTGEDW